MKSPDAFPVPADYCTRGMTLREWFAGQSLPAVMAKFVAQGSVYSDDYHGLVAAECYKLAAAMLAVSAEKRGQGTPTA